MGYEQEQRISARMLQDALERKHFSLVVGAGTDPGKLAQLAVAYQVEFIIDLCADLQVEEALVAAGSTVFRHVAFANGTNFERSDFYGPHTHGPHVQVIKALGASDVPESLPRSANLRWHRMPEPLQRSIRNAFTSTTVLMVEVNPNHPAVESAIFVVLQSLGRMARHHLLLLAESAVQEMGMGFPFEEQNWRENRGVHTLVVPDQTGLAQFTLALPPPA